MILLPAARALRKIGGMGRTRTLYAMGVSSRELRRAAAAEKVLRPRQGLYALPDTVEAQFHAATHSGVPASTTAARLHGLWVLEDQKTHVWLGGSGRNLRDRPDGCCLHWSGGTVPAGELPSVPRTLLQIAQCHDEERFFAAYESALRRRLLTPDGIRWLRRHLPVRMRWLIDSRGMTRIADSSRSSGCGCIDAASMCAPR